MAEINNFTIVRNGYNPAEVDRKIEALNNEIKRLDELLEAYSSQVSSMNTQYVNLLKRYQNITSDLSQKEKAAVDIKRMALKEANAVVEKARQNGEEIERQAWYKGEKIIRDSCKYADDVKVYKEKLSGLLIDFLKLLEECEDPILPDSVDFLEK